MQERTFELAGGSLHYEVKDGKAWINGYAGTDSEVVIPGELDGCPVIVLGKKAFLSTVPVRKYCTGQIQGDVARSDCKRKLRRKSEVENNHKSRYLFQRY